MKTNTNNTQPKKKSSKKTYLAISHFGHPEECTNTTGLFVFKDKRALNAWKKEQYTDGAEYYDFDLEDYVTVCDVETKLQTGYAVMYLEEESHACNELNITPCATLEEAVAEILPRICELDSSYCEGPFLYVLNDKYIVPFDVEDADDDVKKSLELIVCADVPDFNGASDEVKTAYDTVSKKFEISVADVINKFHEMANNSFVNYPNQLDIVDEEFAFESDYEYCKIWIEKF